MLKKVRYYILAFAVLFIGVNLFLLLKEDSKAERTVYVSEWERIKNGNVTQTFKTEGVALPESEQYVYFDEEEGELASIYVKEGEFITAGTSLFSYDSEELEKQKSEIEIEIERLESEIDSVEEQLADLKKIDTKSSARNRSSKESNSEVTVNVDVNVDFSLIAESQVEESIAAAKAEIGKLEAKLNASEQKLDQLDEQIDNVTVYSDTDGIVTQINKDLKAPIITISSNQLVVEGLLSEKQMKDAEVGQKVTMYSELHKKTYEGVISLINEYPTELPSIGKEPVYAFLATFNEEEQEADAEDEFAEIEEEASELSDEAEGIESEEETEKDKDRLFAGTNLQVKVIVEEALDLPVILTDVTYSAKGKEYVYKLTAAGILERHEVKPALTFKGKSAIESGLAAGEVITTQPNAVPVNKVSYIMPMKMTGIKTKEIKNMRKKHYAKYVLMGLLEN
ncbi:hypothetical protein IEO70_11895 [Bacillus sp. AGMB 02131]|uniref:YknX-like barrel-sandwich hybrid domain-containing protein n=1 Tax=Peribacillus faecalis TaxID=2772559 RepID=A0A927CYK9_9BACI|nr:hypothetical protein [Peribacillus faecalis]MBD3109062.1 hypothetical protein [Peribacillus faecalis]